MTKRFVNRKFLGSAVLVLLALCCVGLLTITGSNADPLNQGASCAPAYDPAVGFRPWDAVGRETPTESWPEWLLGWSSDGEILTNPPVWYVSPELPAGSEAALYFVVATKQGEGGVILKLPTGKPPAGATWSWAWSPNAWGESEVLLKGIREGAEVIKK